MLSSPRSLVRAAVALVVSIATLAIAAPPAAQAQDVSPQPSTQNAANATSAALFFRHSSLHNIDLRFWLRWLLHLLLRARSWHAGMPTADVTLFLPGSPEASVASGLVQTMADARAGQFTGVQNRPLSPEAQRALLGLADDADAGAAGVAGLVSGLVANGNDGANPQAEALAESFQNLLVYPETLQETVVALNAFVDASSEEFLRNPTDEFLAIHSSLDILVATANETIALR